MDEISQIEMKTQPAGAAKEGRPYHTAKGHCKCSGVTIWLEICCLMAVAGASAKYRKSDQYEDGNEYYDDQDLDCGKQESPEGYNRAKQGYHHQNECGDAAKCF